MSTLLAYSISNITDLIPESIEFIKKASIDEEFPIDNKDSALASGLQMEYLLKIAHRPVDPYVFDKVQNAIDLYGIRDNFEKLAKDMTRRSVSRLFEETPSTLCKKARDHFDYVSSRMYKDIDQVVDAAEAFEKSAALAGEELPQLAKRYAGQMRLDKSASLKALNSRIAALDIMSKSAEDYSKLRDTLETMNHTYGLDVPLVRDICKTVTEMDKQAGLSNLGFDFYKEALVDDSMIKEALYVKLANNDVPYEKLEKVGYDNFSHYIGKDVADEMKNGPVAFKTVMETLPLDLQKLAYNLTKNV